MQGKGTLAASEQQRPGLIAGLGSIHNICKPQYKVPAAGPSSGRAQALAGRPDPVSVQGPVPGGHLGLQLGHGSREQRAVSKATCHSWQRVSLAGQAPGEGGGVPEGGAEPEGPAACRPCSDGRLLAFLVAGLLQCPPGTGKPHTDTHTGACERKGSRTLAPKLVHISAQPLRSCCRREECEGL